MNLREVGPRREDLLTAAQMQHRPVVARTEFVEHAIKAVAPLFAERVDRSPAHRDGRDALVNQRLEHRVHSFSRWSARAASRSANLLSLPVAVRGSSATTSTRFGHL